MFLQVKNLLIKTKIIFENLSDSNGNEKVLLKLTRFKK